MIDLRRNSPDAQSILSSMLLVFAIMAIVLYVLFQSRFIMAGPAIAFTSPENGAVVYESITQIKGNAERIAFIELNGKRIYIDENGDFNEKLPLLEGHNIIELQAKDRFGRIVVKNLYLKYEGE